MMTYAQLDLADQPHFDGDDIDHARDGERLTGQLLRIWEVIKDGKWYTLTDISIAAKATEASVSAQLRNLRKHRFGGHEIEKEYLDDGLYRYRLTITSNKKEAS